MRKRRLSIVLNANLLTYLVPLKIETSDTIVCHSKYKILTLPSVYDATN